jgi:hypothetical protein
VAIKFVAYLGYLIDVKVREDLPPVSSILAVT